MRFPSIKFAWIRACVKAGLLDDLISCQDHAALLDTWLPGSRWSWQSGCRWSWQSGRRWSLLPWLDSLESCCETTSPCLSSFLALPLILSILPLHSPSTRRNTNTNWVLSSTVTATSLPHANPSIFLSGVVHGHQPTCVYRTAFARSQIQKRERQWQRGYRRRPTAMETQQENDRDRSTLSTGISSRVHSFRVVDSRQNLDANQSN